MTVPGEIINLKVDQEPPYLPRMRVRTGVPHLVPERHRRENNPVKSTRTVYRVILICPECGARYDVGWQVTFSEPSPGL